MKNKIRKITAGVFGAFSAAIFTAMFATAIFATAIFTAIFPATAKAESSWYLGYGLGYHGYEEMLSHRNNQFLMRIDTGAFLLFAGYKSEFSALKMETNAKMSYGVGRYKGALLQQTEDGGNKKVTSIDGMFVVDAELKAGYNLFGISAQKLYLQSGVGYFFNKNEFTPMQRLQGYLYVPAEIQSIFSFGDKELDLLAGYHYLVQGHHFSQAKQYGLDRNYYAKQKKGHGLKAHVGVNFKGEGGNKQGVRLAYRYWYVDDAKESGDAFSYADQEIWPGGVYEPRNKSHIVDLQFLFYF